MSTTNQITTKWLGKMAFESNNPSGLNFTIDAGPDAGGEGNGLKPKALMLSALAGCSGLDVAMLIKKMKLDVENFSIETIANLTDEHPKVYDKVHVTYKFYGNDFKKDKIEKSVSLSVDRYCGVFEMFRKFSDISHKIEYIEQ